MAFSCFLAGCVGMGAATGPSPARHSVRYIASGTADSADVTISNENHDLVSFGCRELPWTYDFQQSFHGRWLHISGQSCCESGSVTVKVFVDGYLCASATGYEPYASATAEGFTGLARP